MESTGISALSGFHHVKLPVADVGRSREWYERVLGLKLSMEFVEDGVLIGVALRSPDGSVQPACPTSCLPQGRGQALPGTGTDSVPVASKPRFFRDSALGETTRGRRAMGTMDQVNVADWRHHGACRTHDPDQLFVAGAAQRQAKIVCTGCPVRLHCLAEALDRRIEFGVWGGMTERERRALLHRRPDVRNWAELLEGPRNTAFNHG